MSIVLSAGVVGLLPDARFVALRQGEGMTTSAQRRHHRRQVLLLAVCVSTLAVVVLFAVLHLAGVT